MHDQRHAQVARRGCDLHVGAVKYGQRILQPETKTANNALADVAQLLDALVLGQVGVLQPTAVVADGQHGPAGSILKRHLHLRRGALRSSPVAPALVRRRRAQRLLVQRVGDKLAHPVAGRPRVQHALYVQVE